MNYIPRVQEKLAEYALDAVIVSSEKNQRYVIDLPLMDGFVLIARKKAWLITDQRYAEAAEKALGGTIELRIASPGQEKLKLLCAALKECAAQRVGVEEEKLSCGDFWALQNALPCELLPAQELFRILRASKTQEELAYMRQAQDISERALEEVLKIIKPGMTERQVAAELIFRMLRHGSDGGEFRPIVVSGENTSLPHGEPSDRVICEGDFLTMDFGCSKNGYCSDMTRTVAVGSATEEMRHIYSIVLEAQLTGIAAARPGVPGCEIDAAARCVITDAGYGRYFVHGFGHGIGLDGHEMPGASPTSKTPLPVGAMISAEPGIYLPGRFGVRIEDVLIITEDGNEVITKAPKELLIL